MLVVVFHRTYLKRRITEISRRIAFSELCLLLMSFVLHTLVANKGERECLVITRALIVSKAP